MTRLIAILVTSLSLFGCASMVEQYMTIKEKAKDQAIEKIQAAKTEICQWPESVRKEWRKVIRKETGVDTSPLCSEPQEMNKINPIHIEEGS